MTFVLFDLTSGDPAAAMLGKHALPDEIDALRSKLGSDLPLFYGRMCKTSAFSEYSVTDGRTLCAQANYPAKNIVAVITYADHSRAEIRIADGESRFCHTLPAGKKVNSCKFFRRQDSPWNSRFLRALQELVAIKSEFPYVTFFNFGETLSTREPVAGVLKRGVGPSLCLMLPIFCGEIVCGIVLALVSVAFIGKWQDRMLLFLAVFTMSMSYLVAIIFGQFFCAYYQEWFPLWGFDGPKYFVLPVLIGIICGVGSNMRFFRTVFADELNKEYLRSALAKGVHPASIYYKHLLRNAAVQIITRAGAGLPFLFTGSLLLESFFGIPGLGFAGMEALMNSDIQLLKALVLLSSVLFVVMNLLTDIAYAWADPRIKLG